MKISQAGSRTAKKWEVKEISFEKLAERVSKPTVTHEDYRTYLNLSKDDQTAVKDVGGFVLGEFKGGIRKHNTIINRSGIALDLDSINSPKNYEKILNELFNLSCEFCLYSTRKNTKENPRIRILFSLARTVNADEYEFLARKLCEILGLEYCDPSTAQPERLMFWPSVSSDMVDQFIYEAQLESDGYMPLDPDLMLNSVEDWRDRTQWPQFPKEGPLRDTGEAVTLDDPRAKEGIVGAFCRTYTIPEVIEAYLPDIYEPTDDPTRYTYSKGSSSKGAVLYGREEFGEDVFLYSFHSTDIAGSRTSNAFDLVRLHKFGDTKVSQDKMANLARDDKKVQRLIAKEKSKDLEEFADSIKGEIDFGEDDKKSRADIYAEILQELQKDERNKSKNASTINNVRIILEKDPFFSDSYYYDAFADKVIVTKKMPWPRNQKVVSEAWKNSDDAGIRWFLETYYQIRGKETIMDALEISFEERAMHPIKDYLESLEWDGVERVETLLVDYFGARDCVYTRDVMRKSLVAAVTRIYEPGAKYDTMPILVGDQGVGKSTFIRKLGQNWYSDSVTDFVGKESYELLQNNWLIEIPELNGFTKFEMNQIKHFLSKQIDEFRAPYKRRKESHPRQCVFFGTTNEQTFLRDRTGNRRFWPVQLGVNEPTKSVFDDLDDEIDQIWAEAYFLYTIVGEKLYLEGESKRQSEIEQASRLEEDPSVDLIVDFLKREVPEDWNEWSLSDRLNYWDNPDMFGEVKTVPRTKICSAEIIQECFREKITPSDRRQGSAVNRILETLPGVEKIQRTARFGKAYKPAKGYRVEPDKL